MRCTVQRTALRCCLLHDHRQRELRELAAAFACQGRRLRLRLLLVLNHLITALTAALLLYPSYHHSSRITTACCCWQINHCRFLPVHTWTSYEGLPCCPTLVTCDTCHTLLPLQSCQLIRGRADRSSSLRHLPLTPPCCPRSRLLSAAGCQQPHLLACHIPWEWLAAT